MSEQKSEPQTPRQAEDAASFTPQVAMIDPKELVTLVASTVAEVLKPLLDKIGSNNTDLISQKIGEGVAAGIASTQRRKVSFGEYIAKPHSPNRQDLSIKLHRVCMQNGFYLADSLLTDNEIYLLNKITHSGRYCDRFVEVAVLVDGAESQVDIRFPNATADQRFALREHVDYSPRRHRTVFQAMLEQIVDEQDQERAEKEVDEEMRNQVRAIARERLNRQATSNENEAKPLPLNAEPGTRPGQGHIGGSKNFREAQERAAAKEAARHA